MTYPKLNHERNDKVKKNYLYLCNPCVDELGMLASDGWTSYANDDMIKVFLTKVPAL